MTLSLAAVFLPFLFLGGIVGGLLREFGVTIAVAILVSGVVSLTLTPMMAARMLRPDHERKHGALYQAIERAFDGAQAFYVRTLKASLRHRFAMVLLSALVLAATVLLFREIPKGFLPTEDNDQVNINTEAVEGISYAAAKVDQERVAELVRQQPEVAAFMSFVGSGGGRGGSNTGRIFMRLLPRTGRDKSADEVGRELSQRLSVHTPSSHSRR
jgi:HAE1 family hydrophobic/amphiphilic exporter-1